MKYSSAIIFALIFLSGCNFSKSVKIDLISGLTTNGDLISCENVNIVVDNQNITRTTFYYGESFNMDFNNLGGLKMENGKVFPGMELYVTTSSGDTVLAEKDLYSDYVEGINSSPLILSASVTAARPIHSGGEYALYIRIWDKKDKGTFVARLNFKVVAGQNIKVEATSGISWKEIYLFTKSSGKVINNNAVKVNDDTYMLFEGLTGFTEADARVYPGLSIKATSENGDVLLDYEDLFSDYTVTGVDAAEFKNQVSSSFIFKTTEIKTPISLTVTIWDKKSDAKIKTSANLTLEE